jgi:hypothetical protein
MSDKNYYLGQNPEGSTTNYTLNGYFKDYTLLSQYEYFSHLKPSPTTWKFSTVIQESWNHKYSVSMFACFQS